MSVIPESKTKKELQAEREKTERVRREAEEMRDQLLRLQVGHAPARAAIPPSVQKTTKKSMSELSTEQRASQGRPGSSESTGQAISSTQVQRAQIQFSGPNGAQIKQGSTKPLRISSARPILNRSGLQSDQKAIKAPPKKPAPILGASKVHEASKDSNKELRQQYQALYRRAMKGLGPEKTDQDLAFKESQEYKGVQEVIKNFAVSVEQPLQVANSEVSQLNQNQSIQKQDDYEGCDIFEDDQQVKKSCDCQCGDDVPYNLDTDVRAQQNSSITQGKGGISVSVGIGGPDEVLKTPRRACGCETERIELSPRTRGILDGLVNANNRWRPGSADPERRRRLIERVLAEDEEDEGITVEDIMAELNGR